MSKIVIAVPRGRITTECKNLLLKTSFTPDTLLFDKNTRKFLIPTAEVILTNMVKNQIINIKSLPMRLVASTPVSYTHLRAHET